jgi:hypothetical protein
MSSVTVVSLFPENICTISSTLLSHDDCTVQSVGASKNQRTNLAKLFEKIDNEQKKIKPMHRL